VILDSRHYFGEVVERIDRTRLAGSDERVEADERLVGRGVADEKVVLPATGSSA